MYRNIVFLQCENAYEPLDILNSEGEDKAIEYLSQWDYGEGEETINHLWGNSDTIYRKDNYILSYNERLSYITLYEEVKDEK